MDSLKRAGAKAFFWDYSGRFIQHGMGFLVTIILARILTPTDFGLVALVMSVITIASTVSDAGLGAALIRKRRLLSVHYSSVFFVNVVLGLLLTATAFFLAPYIAGFYLNPDLLKLTQALSPLFFLWALSSLQAIRQRKNLNYALLTKVGVVASLVGGVVGIYLALNGAGVWSLVIQSLVHASIYNVLLWASSKWRPTMQFSTKALRGLWAFGSSVFVVDLLEAVFAKLDNLIIGKLFAADTLGYFSRAKALDQMISSYSSASLMSVLFPVLSKVQNNLPAFRAIIIKSLGIISFVVFMLLGIFYLSSFEIVTLLFGPKWVQTVSYFQILVISGFGYPVSALLVNTIYSRGAPDKLLRLELAKKIILGLNLAIAFRWGVEGYLYGLIIATVLSVFLNMLYSAKVIEVALLDLIKPVAVQAALTVTIVFFVLLINENVVLPKILMLFVKTAEFILIYLIANKLFATKSFEFFLQEMNSVFTAFRQRRHASR